MLIYFFLFFVLLLLSFSPHKWRQFFFLLSFCVLLFIGFFRAFEVGADNIVYNANFIATRMSPSTWSSFTEFEPGFAWFMAFFKTYISNDYLLFMGTIFCMFMFGVLYLTVKESRNHILTLFFLVALLYYFQSFNIMRQFTALGLYCFTIPLLKNKKYIYIHIVCILFLSFFIHRSLIALLLIPLCFYTKLNVLFSCKKYLYIILIVSYPCVFLSQLFYNYVPSLAVLLSFMGDRYVGYVNASIDAEITISKATSLLNTVMALYLVKVIPQTKLKSIYFVAYILGVLLSNTLGAFSELFLRISTNFLFFRVILYTDLWYEIPCQKTRFFYRYIVCFYCFILFSNAMLKDFGHVVPYINRLISL